MATDFTLTSAASAIYPGAASGLCTITMDAVAGSPVSLALSAAYADGTAAGGAFTSTPVVIATGGLSGFFTYTPSATAKAQPITITAVASGGLVMTHSLTLLLNYPFVGDSAGDIMADALSMLGVLADGEPVPGERLATGLRRLNDIVSSLRVDTLWTDSAERVQATLKAGVQRMTIGPSGDIVTKLSPVEILDGSFFSIGQIDYPMQPLTQGQYHDIGFKKFNAIGPDGYWLNTGTPNGAIDFYPQASSDIPLTLHVRTSLVSFADPTTPYGLPPGYKRMLTYTLARDWGPTFRRELSASQERTGAIARRDVQRANHETPRFSTQRQGNIIIGWET